MHLLFVGWSALRPLDVPWVGPANLHPLAGIRADLDLGPREAVVRIGADLLLLAPLGVLLPLVGGRLAVSPLGSLVCTVAAAALLSLAIELWQTGVPGRVPDVDALLLNPLGVAVAHLAVVPAARARLRRGAEQRAGAGTSGGTGTGTRATGAGEFPDDFTDDFPEMSPVPLATQVTARTAGGALGDVPEGGCQGATPRMTRVHIAP